MRASVVVAGPNTVRPDIEGGSLEVALGRRGRKPEFAASLPLGAHRLTKTFFGSAAHRGRPDCRPGAKASCLRDPGIEAQADTDERLDGNSFAGDRVQAACVLDDVVASTGPRTDRRSPG
ncbi:Ppx/GppA phosphatase family protein [Streptomyces sp. NPDC001450]